MSELSGYDSASPLVALRNVFPSRCDLLCTSEQFFAHIKDSECFHRIERFLLAYHNGLDNFLVDSFCVVINHEVIFH